ncbi:hypothetical protein L596_005336 [Steinernema carpocapsae]|uniref:Uncharacterized protein n=1 Tax=Steinernema carpocapsae TaxID=34508 RepID=A0A4U8UYY0_STECR|nr:hypothetical protein L596_005336 [Steinernema carpocapsae]
MGPRRTRLDRSPLFNKGLECDHVRDGSENSIRIFATGPNQSIFRGLGVVRPKYASRCARDVLRSQKCTWRPHRVENNHKTLKIRRKKDCRQPGPISQHAIRNSAIRKCNAAIRNPTIRNPAILM